MVGPVAPDVVMAMAPTNIGAPAWASNNWCQVLPPSWVFHTPPPAVAAYNVLVGSKGSATTPVIRPVTGATLVPRVWLLATGAGPWLNQVWGWPATGSPFPETVSDLPAIVMLPSS